MRLYELAGKEIVNIMNGARLGVVGESDMLIDADTGEIMTIILPSKRSFISLWVDKQEVEIPWEAVKKIGSEVIIVELDQTKSNYRRFML